MVFVTVATTTLGTMLFVTTELLVAIGIVAINVLVAMSVLPCATTLVTRIVVRDVITVLETTGTAEVMVEEYTTVLTVADETVTARVVVAVKTTEPAKST